MKFWFSVGFNVCYSLIIIQENFTSTKKLFMGFTAKIQWRIYPSATLADGNFNSYLVWFFVSYGKNNSTLLNNVYVKNRKQSYKILSELVQNYRKKIKLQLDNFTLGTICFETFVWANVVLWFCSCSFIQNVGIYYGCLQKKKGQNTFLYYFQLVVSKTFK